jgi:23S rRNA (pseudouridine1915-N3)-methyltransferase
VRIHLLSVGKPRDREFGLLHDRYARRIGRMGVAYTTGWVPEVAPGGRYSDDHVREREARSLRDALEAAEPGTLIALDRKGRIRDSRQLVRLLERWATPRATFVIGGPLGLHPDFAAEAQARWSLSALTFPHELARVLVVEQLYRALTIQRGVPYHK